MQMPPLNALRAFEAAARHGSIARAAEELHVTQGAVSRHVKLLEEHLQTPLFRRLPKGLELTAQGKALLPELSVSFLRIVEAARAISTSGFHLKIMVAPTLASRWLIARLPEFRARHAGIAVSIGGFHEGYDEFLAGGYDAGIGCYGFMSIRPPEFDAILIRRERLTPVCSPSLLKTGPRLESIEDLAQHRLLHPDPSYWDWQTWLEAVDMINEIDFRAGETYFSSEATIKAAVAGLGITIADLHFVTDEIASGQLITPFEAVATENTGYFFFVQHARADEEPIVAFRDWLIEAAHSESATPRPEIAQKSPIGR